MSIPPKPAANRFKGPVHWLLSSKLLAAAKQISIYANFGNKLDPKDWMRAEPIGLDHHPPGPSEGEFWFDYIADTGDGQAASYSVAYLALSDFVVGPGSATSPALPALAFAEPGSTGTRLPRGGFLFIGGDSSYHVADFPTLAARLQAPWCWAVADWEQQAGRKVAQRPVYAIPGNHDYYDFLDGFNRQFLRPVAPDVEPPVSPAPTAPHRDSASVAQLHIPAFERLQNASYVALELPFGWRLLGLDAQAGKIDRRQRRFFRNFVSQPAPAAADHDCRKLIVATPEPTTVFGQRATADAPIVKGLREIGLATPFVAAGSAQSPAVAGSESECCRLDLAGDTHHYSRYWGPDAHLKTTAYAAVIAGGGGAFLHPTETDFGEVAARVAYPRPADSRVEVTSRLLNPLVILTGGMASAIGAVATTLLVLAISSAASVRDAVTPLLTPLGLNPAHLAPTTGSLAMLRVALERPTAGLPLLHPDLGKILLFLLALVGGAAWSARRSTNLRERTPRELRRISGGHQLMFLLIALFAPFTIGWIAYRPAQPAPHPLTASLLLVLLATTGAIGHRWDSWYCDALFAQSYQRELTTRDRAVRWLIASWAVALPIFGAAYYGSGPFIAVVFDAVCILIVLGLLALITTLAIKVGAERHARAGKFGFGLLGAWHAIVQLTVPVIVVLSARPDPLGLGGQLVAYAAVSFGFALLAIKSLRAIQSLLDRRARAAGWLLLAAWTAVLATIVAIAIRNNATAMAPTIGGWQLLLAVVVGGLLSAISFGWYLAVALGFGGHNNEAGGAARIVKYRHLLRVRLTATGLTAYAIAIDEPNTDGHKLRPRLVDVFELTCRCAPATGAATVR